MAKAKTEFACNACGAVASKWSGQCEACGEWNTLEEQSSAAHFTKAKQSSKGSSIELRSLGEAAEEVQRVGSHASELDRVLGGGIVPGAAMLIGGDPGIGKSTLLLQLMAELSRRLPDCVYITGEESVAQVQLRAKRLGVETAPLTLAAATNVRDIIATLKTKQPPMVVIDSIQTMFVPEVESAPGTVSQVRVAAHELISHCKAHDIALVLVGHVTKDGAIAGPKLLEHMVDTVLYFEGDRHHQFRLIRAIKNRFGAANEIGVFEMRENGLQEVTNPSALFMNMREEPVPGCAVFAGMEGSRPMLLDIEALVSPSAMATPRRAVVGWDQNRLSMILAVLQRHAGVQSADKEVFLNVAGGLKIQEPAADMAVALALLSSISGIALPKHTVCFGEVSLSGDIRKVSHMEQRVREAAKLGFTRAIVPPGQYPAQKDFTYTQVADIAQLRTVLA